MVTMKLRHPYTTASIWSSGKITCTGANTEQEAKTAARKFSRILQKLGKKNSLWKTVFVDTDPVGSLTFLVLFGRTGIIFSHF
jgi:TATA-box binding protein (TBP) (component of TFIID and TFIIIB)